MGADGLDQLVADGEHGVEAVLRVLKDEADLRSRIDRSTSGWPR